MQLTDRAHLGNHRGFGRWNGLALSPMRPSVPLQLEYSLVVEMYAVRVPALATRVVEIWNMALHKIRARSEQRGPQGHTGLACTSSESHRMGRTERRHPGYKGQKSNTTRPRALPPPNRIHDLANQIATAPSRRKPRRQVDFQPAGTTPLDCARLREEGWRRIVTITIALAKHDGRKNIVERATRVSLLWRRRVHGGLRIRDETRQGFPIPNSTIPFAQGRTNMQLGGKCRHCTTVRTGAPGAQLPCINAGLQRSSERASGDHQRGQTDVPPPR